MGIFLFNGLGAHAQALLNDSLVPHPYSSLKTLAGYQPSVIASEQDAQKIYDALPTSTFTMNSGCFQRAHNWAVQMNQSQQIRSMKVFLFFTARYQREFDYEWEYHVAPLIPVQTNDGSIQEMVFDPTFTSAPSWARGDDRKNYDNKPVSIDQWVQYFIYPDVKCPVAESWEEVQNYQEKYYCYVMKAPMYNYIPLNFEEDGTGAKESWQDFFSDQTHTRFNWREGDLLQMKRGLKPSAR